MRSALFVYCLTHKKINRPLRLDMEKEVFIFSLKKKPESTVTSIT